jgi:hypothetical protein
MFWEPGQTINQGKTIQPSQLGAGFKGDDQQFRIVFKTVVPDAFNREKQ